ncbi:MAG: hypothetical protein FJ091_20775 [Deltaproteobacteria bacterium]|nr:hypothetical protein [Deltaproteobacteria bacterium]
MDELDFAINGLWLGGLQLLAWVGLTALCVVLLVDLIQDRTRNCRVVWVDLALILAAAFTVDAEVDASRVPFRLCASFVLLDVAVGRRWQRGELRTA